MNLLMLKNKDAEFLKEFIDSNLVEKGNTKNTASAYKNDLMQFLNWTENKNYDLKSIDENQIEKYLVYLGKRGYKESSISRKTSCLKAFFKFLLKESYKKNNVMKNITRNNKSKGLPKSLSDKEVNQIFNYLEKTKDKNKLRNKAIFEILYGCGLRVSELINLDIENINFEESQIKCTGKGNKQRIVPTNDNCLKSINDYIELERNI
jgi:Site-specific recombinase XerD